MKLMKNWWRTRTALISGGIVIVVLSAACVQLAPMARTRFATGAEVSDAAQAVRPVSAPAATNSRAVSRPAVSGPRTAVVVRGPIAQLTTVSGRVAGTDELPLAFSSGERVQTISVRPGEAVEAGQVLAEADAREVLRELATARSQLETSMARLTQSQAQAGSRQQDAAQRAQLEQLRNQRGVVEAEMALRKAESDLEQLRAGPPVADQRMGEAAVATAQATLERAQADLARLQVTSADVQVAEQELANARITLQRAEADHARLRAGADPADVRAAEREMLAAQAELDRANADLNRLTRGPDPQAVSAAQRDVDRAQAAVRAAQGVRADTAAARATRDDNVRRAESDLEQAQQRLTVANQPPKQVDVDLARNKAQSAQLAFETARDKFERVQRGPDQVAVDAASLAVSRAKLGVETAETKLATVKAGPTDAQYATAVAVVESAKSGVVSAEARLAEINSHPTPAELRDGQDRVSLARSSLTRAVAEASLAGGGSIDASAYDTLVQQKAIEQDRTLVETLERDLENMRLKAPSAGIVTAVLAAPSDAIQSGRPVVILARPGDPVVQVDLADNEAARLAVGQDALVLIEGTDGARLEGVITSISSREAGLGKTVTLRVTWAETRVAYGVPAQVGFTTAMRGDALLVPEKAIRSNGARNYVEYMEGPSRRAVDVQTGIVAGGMVEVVSGLHEGQTVLVRP